MAKMYVPVHGILPIRYSPGVDAPLAREKTLYRRILYGLCKEHGISIKTSVYSTTYVLIDCLAQRYAALHYYRRGQKNHPGLKEEEVLQRMSRDIEKAIIQLEQHTGKSVAIATGKPTKAKETADALKGATAEFLDQAP